MTPLYLIAIRILLAELPAREAVAVEVDVEIRNDVLQRKGHRHAIAEDPVGARALHGGPRRFELRRRRAGERARVHEGVRARPQLRLGGVRPFFFGTEAQHRGRDVAGLAVDEYRARRLGLVSYEIVISDAIEIEPRAENRIVPRLGAARMVAQFLFENARSAPGQRRE